MMSGAWTRIEWHVAQRDFFALASMENDPVVLQALASDPQLAALQSARDRVLQQAATSCHDAVCFDNAVRWSDGDIANVAAALGKLAVHNPAIHSFAEKTLRESGAYILYQKQPADQFIGSIWTDSANAMNRILSVYGEGTPPFYAHIDSMRYDPKSFSYVQYLRAITTVIAAEEQQPPRPFFFPAMKYAVMLLAANDRLDAGRFEPLESSQNAPAAQRVRSVRWRKYPYSVILVPGEGPEQPGVEISPLGRIRVEQAAMLYREKKAPFILVSGGPVHPMLTKYDEAMEMRKELEEQWGVPADAILVDPYARHTTTNLRNAVREVIRYGIPTGKLMLIASDPAQIAMIAKPAFTARCLREMHLLPWTTLRQIERTEIEMLPSRDSLQENAADPMDP